MKVLNFLIDNYQILVVLAISIANLFVCLFRKKVKVVDSVYQFILERLPTYIALAEVTLTEGKDKKSFVIQSILGDIAATFGSTGDYIEFISDNIEKILCTPEKKEVRK